MKMFKENLRQLLNLVKQTVWLHEAKQLTTDRGLTPVNLDREKKSLTDKERQKKDAHLETGKRGEEIAKKYLEKKGYKIIERNYKTKYAEIDLVARQKNELVLVEVRTKIGNDFGAPEDTINDKKRRKLRGNALAYARGAKWKGSLRIDAVCIVLKTDYSIERLNHYENIIEDQS